jgi:hypothetical protein
VVTDEPMLAFKDLLHLDAFIFTKNIIYWGHFGQHLIIISKMFIFQAILELNVTELSHSQDHVGAEVFVEPYSFICLLGTKFEKSSPQTEKVAESDQVTEDEERPKVT